MSFLQGNSQSFVKMFSLCATAILVVSFISFAQIARAAVQATTTNQTSSSSAQCAAVLNGVGAQSQWVTAVNGTLNYKTLPKGDRIIDFSYAGYKGGGVAIPQVPVVKRINPSGSDDTAAIQEALDALASTAPSSEGIRGAIVLGPGTFTISKPILISVSGIVLRGSGSGIKGTTLRAAGTPQTFCKDRTATEWDTEHQCDLIKVYSPGKVINKGSATTITDSYVPMGTRSFNVNSTTGIAPGDQIAIKRPITQEWIQRMGMTVPPLIEYWLTPGNVMTFERTVTAINGNTITVDVPFTDPIDREAMGTTTKVVPITRSGGVSNVGIESMNLVAPVYVVAISEPNFEGIYLGNVTDGWVRDVLIQDFEYGLRIAGGKRLTIDRTTVTRTKEFDYNLPGGNPFDFTIGGEQVLVIHSAGLSKNNPSYVTGTYQSTLNVLYDFLGNDSIAPHARWATGLLVDNSKADSIQFKNRGTAGGGHGWPIGGGVVWNSDFKEYIVQKPPVSQNWFIGSTGVQSNPPTNGTGATEPLGAIDSPSVKISIPSLYMAQLCERLGPSALLVVGSAPSTVNTNTPVVPDVTDSSKVTNPVSVNIKTVTYDVDSGWINRGGKLSKNGSVWNYTENSGSGAHYNFIRTTKVKTTDIITFSFDVKRVSGKIRNVQASIYNADNPNAGQGSATCVLSNSSHKTSGGSAAIVFDSSNTKLRDGWYTCSVKVKPDSVSGSSVGLAIRFLDGDEERYTGDTDTVFSLRNIQIEFQKQTKSAGVFWNQLAAVINAFSGLWEKIFQMYPSENPETVDIKTEY